METIVGVKTKGSAVGKGGGAEGMTCAGGMTGLGGVGGGGTGVVDGTDGMKVGGSLPRGGALEMAGGVITLPSISILGGAVKDGVVIHESAEVADVADSV